MKCETVPEAPIQGPLLPTVKSVSACAGVQLEVSDLSPTTPKADMKTPEFPASPKSTAPEPKKGAIMIRIGFWGPLSYNYNKEPPE